MSYADLIARLRNCRPCAAIELEAADALEAQSRVVEWHELKLSDDVPYRTLWFSAGEPLHVGFLMPTHDGGRYPYRRFLMTLEPPKVRAEQHSLDSAGNPPA